MLLDGNRQFIKFRFEAAPVLDVQLVRGEVPVLVPQASLFIGGVLAVLVFCVLCFLVAAC